MRRRRPKAAFPNPKISKIIRGPSSFSHLETKKRSGLETEPVSLLSQNSPLAAVATIRTGRETESQ